MALCDEECNTLERAPTWTLSNATNNWLISSGLNSKNFLNPIVYNLQMVQTFRLPQHGAIWGGSRRFKLLLQNVHFILLSNDVLFGRLQASSQMVDLNKRDIKMGEIRTLHLDYWTMTGVGRFHWPLRSNGFLCSWVDFVACLPEITQKLAFKFTVQFKNNYCFWTYSLWLLIHWNNCGKITGNGRGCALG